MARQGKDKVPRMTPAMHFVRGWIIVLGVVLAATLIEEAIRLGGISLSGVGRGIVDGAVLASGTVVCVMILRRAFPKVSGSR